MSETLDDNRRLEGCITDLISVLAFPALRSGREPSWILTTLLDSLVGMLRLDFAYARLPKSVDQAPEEIVRVRQLSETTPSAAETGRLLAPWLTTETSSPHLVPSPLGAGQISIASVRLGLREDMGILIAGSRAAGFPTKIDMLLLRVATNQAVIGLQEARRLVEPVTDRKRAEQQLASLVANSADFIGMSSLDGRVLFVNPAGQAMVGLDGDDHVARTQVLDYVMEEDRERIELLALPAVFQEGRWDGETRFRHFQTGAPVVMHTQIFFVKDPQTNERLALATISRDITQRKQSEHDLQTLQNELASELVATTRLHEFSTRLPSDGKLTPLFEELLDAAITLQGADFGDIQLYNPTTQALEIVAQRGFAKEFLDYFNAAQEGTGSCGKALLEKQRVIVEDVQTDLLFEPHRKVVAAAGFRAVQSTPLFSRSGQPIGVLSTHFREPHRPSDRELQLTDLYAMQAAEIIERKQAEARLAYHANLLANVHDAIIATDDKLRLTSWNPAAEQMYGWKAEEVLGRNALEVIPSDVSEEQRSVALETLAETGRFHTEAVQYRRDGARIWVESNVIALRDESERVTGFVVANRDFTERKRMQDALDYAQAELAHVTRVLTMGELTASIAHEVNQPLAAIVTNAHACQRWLQATPPNAEEAQAALDRIIRNANRASGVITGIRTYLRREPSRRAPVDIDSALRDVLRLVQGEARAHGASLRVLSTPHLPRVVADRVQLQQVILNLVMNGFESMSAIDDLPRLLDVGAEIYGADTVKVFVRDSGPGIGTGERSRIFSAFHTTKVGGMGMGLAICRTIVESHGGQLWATPNEGPGETFQFTVPIAAPEPQPEPHTKV